MGNKRVAGQQGQSNTSFAVQVVEAVANYVARNQDYQLWAKVTGLTLTLPPKPYVGLEILVGIDTTTAVPTDTVTVAGGGNPIAGGDFTLKNQEATRLVFSRALEWVPECCPQFDEQTLSAVLNAVDTTASATFVDLLSLPITTTKGKKLAIWSSFSSSVTESDSAAEDEFQLAVVGPDSILVPLERCKTSMPFGGGSAAGAINNLYDLTVLGPGLYTVKLQWRLATGTLATIDPSAGGHADLIVEETLS
jgi:hypothetical protein